MARYGRQTIQVDTALGVIETCSPRSFIVLEEGNAVEVKEMSGCSRTLYSLKYDSL